MAKKIKKQKAEATYKKHWVTKHNKLNAIRPDNMTLQELRFFTVYLSRINPLDENTRLVRLSLSDFQKIFNLKKINRAEIVKISGRLLGKVATMPLDNGGFRAFQIFKAFEVNNAENECEMSFKDHGFLKSLYTRPKFDTTWDEANGLNSNDIGGWYVEIDAHDEALPLMFNLRRYYFKYRLWNALMLKSVNQLRMYEVLKQCEYLGERIVCVDELKFYLGIGNNEYSRFNQFKVDVLDVCQEALSKHTDISYVYEPYGKKGRGGKILQLRFIITKNANYENPMAIENFVDLSEFADKGGQGETSFTVIEPTPHQRTEPQISDANFEMFFGVIPRKASKESKEDARRAFFKVIESGVSFKQIMAGATAYAEYTKNPGFKPAYAFGAKTFIEQRMWEEDWNSKLKSMQPQNSFHNFKQGEYDWKALEKKERAYLDDKYGLSAKHKDD